MSRIPEAAKTCQPGCIRLCRGSVRHRSSLFFFLFFLRALERMIFLFFFFLPLPLWILFFFFSFSLFFSFFLLFFFWSFDASVRAGGDLRAIDAHAITGERRGRVDLGDTN